eukprot:gene62994-86162_t
MNSREKEIHQFFDNYALIFNRALESGDTDVDEVVKCFAEFFVEASPVGIIGGKNDEGFRKRIPQGYVFYKKIGIQSMDILSKKITLLDEFHTMCKIHWNSVYLRKDGSDGGDEQKALKEN